MDDVFVVCEDKIKYVSIFVCGSIYILRDEIIIAELIQ